jgi:hydrogenase maturation protease
MRDRCPEKISLFGVIPQSYDAGVELTPLLEAKLPGLAELVLEELRSAGYEITTLTAC